MHAVPGCALLPLLPWHNLTSPLPSLLLAAAGEPPERLPSPAQLESATGLTSAAVEAAQGAVRAMLQGDTSAISGEVHPARRRRPGCFQYWLLSLVHEQ